MVAMTIFFVYTGGRAPRDVRRARIAENVDTVPRGAFFECQLIEVEGHDKLKKIENDTFIRCRRLRRVTNMRGVKEIEVWAFSHCTVLSELDFDKLEIVEFAAFASCESLRSINLPSLRRVGAQAFYGCTALTDVVFGKDLERIEGSAFCECPSLRRIAIPLKVDLIIEDRAFRSCNNLSRVDIAGGAHKTISSLHLESWRDHMREVIESINQELPNTLSGWEKTAAIQQWIRSVLDRMEHYKAEHQLLLKEAMTLLELALWKAKLLDVEGRKCEAEDKISQNPKIDDDSARKEHRVTCGANIVIKNVLPFLALE